MDNEKKSKKSGLAAGKDKRTGHGAELEHKNLITAEEVPQRISSRLANELGRHDEHNLTSKTEGSASAVH